ncbi:hypothetical protein Pcinc_001954 [Petrolisthes cinctipes]|uniref:Reverse transcriptase n=1 Tax=Petrolisthes cinctipes TaxID=88211 RepID=A0AAE1GLV9_PETCI|nr:hypothetical protein Pcinc_001954 [Petrolisthes cinctipes]
MAKKDTEHLCSADSEANIDVLNRGTDENGMEIDVDFSLADSFMAKLQEGGDVNESNINSNNLVVLQREDPELESLVNQAKADKREEVVTLLSRYEMVFRGTPGRTTVLEHDVDVSGAPPIEQSPYRVSPYKAEVIRKEVDFMLQNNLVEPCQSE